MSTLTELMRDVADHQPEDGFTDPTTLTALGRGRVHRRHTTAGLVAAAVVALVVTPFAIHAASGPEPAPPTGKMIRLDSAVPGVAGRDYTVLSRVTNEMLTSRHLTTQGVLPDGRLVVSRVEGPRARITGNGVFDPATQSLTLFPARHVGLYLGRDVNLLVYGTPNPSDSNLNTAPDVPYRVYDLATGAWSDLPADRAVDLEWGGSLQSQVVSGGKLYVGMDTAPTRALWSVPLDGSGGWTKIGDVGSFGVGAGTLASTQSLGPDAGALTVRELASGDTRTSSPSPDPGCVQTEVLGISTAYVVRGISCGQPPSGRATQLRILDHDGRPLATVRAGYLILGAVTDSLVTFSVPTEPDNAGHLSGTFAYHPASGRLVRLSPHGTDLRPFQNATDPVRLWHVGPGNAGTNPRAPLFDVVVPH